jgi:hypothetical protein
MNGMMEALYKAVSEPKYDGICSSSGIKVGKFVKWHPILFFADLYEKFTSFP